MRFTDLVITVVSNIRRMKLRLALTALGVIIGTSSVVLMVALGVGLQRNVTGQLSEIGQATHIQVMGSQEGPVGTTGTGGRVVKLDDKAIAKFRQIDHVDAVMPKAYVGVDSITYRRYETGLQVVGVEADLLDDFGYELQSGRYPRTADEIVIGDAVPVSIAGGDPFASNRSAAPTLDLLGERVVFKITRYPDVAEGEIPPEPETIKQRMRVVGILKKADYETDSSVFMDLDEALRLTGEKSNHPEYPLIVVKTDAADSVPDVEKAINDMSFMTFSAQSVQDAIGQTFFIIQAVLGAIGAVAMLVASLGIANTMTMSIYERTREIGIMKALGASNTQVRRIFLTEAGVIGFGGGIGGVALSAGGAGLVNLFMQSTFAASDPTMSGTTLFYIPAWLAFSAIAFAVCVGLLAGVLPAVRAANLDPLVALRHE